jgi:hypothetical protein
MSDFGEEKRPAPDVSREELLALVKAARSCVDDYYIASGKMIDHEGKDGYGSLRALRLALDAFNSSCGAESNRHSGAVGTEKRAEQSNPGGCHEVATDNDQKTHERKAGRDEPTPGQPLSRSDAVTSDAPIKQIDMGYIGRHDDETGRDYEPTDEALIFLNDDNEQTCHVEGPNAKAMAQQIVQAVRVCAPSEPQALGKRPAEFLAWAREMFGPVALVRGERLLRFVEEAIELAHAEGMERLVLDKVAERVYSRPAGDTPKEIGQAQACLETFAKNIGLSSDAEAQREWERVQSIPKTEWDRRHAAKQKIGIALSPSVAVERQGGGE